MAVAVRYSPMVTGRITWSPTGPCPTSWRSVIVRNAGNKHSVDARLDVSCSDGTPCLPTFRRNSVPFYTVSEGSTLNVMAVRKLAQWQCVAFLNTSVPRHFVTVVCLLLIVYHIWMNRRSWPQWGGNIGAALVWFSELQNGLVRGYFVRAQV